MEGHHSLVQIVTLALCGAAAMLALSGAAAATRRKEAVNRFHVPVRMDVRTAMTNPAWNQWFKLNLRCSQRTFELLCKLLEPHFTSTNYLRYNFETSVACTLYHLASSGGYRETAAALGVSKAWCVKAVNQMLRVLCRLSTEYVTMPTQSEEWDEIEEGFRSVNGFPWCAGAVDGTLVEIQRPHNCDGWYNRKGRPSFNVQAVCDHRKKFLAFDVRPGSWSDKMFWKYSKFGKDVEFLVSRGYHILGDSGYALLPVLMTPFPDDGELGRECKMYNYIHSSTRMKIEGAFGLLKERFRVFKIALPAKTISGAVRTVIACMVLHNIMIDLEDDGVSEFFIESKDADDVEVQVVEGGSTVSEAVAFGIAKQKRKEIAQMLMRLAGRS